MTRPLRLAVICDAVEEGWHSMDYCAEMLVKHLQAEHADMFETVPVTPWFFPGFERLGLGKQAFNADRAVTRFVTFPAALLGERGKFDLFHIVDHTYAQLAHVLPAARTGIYCHDLDAFEPILGDAQPRSPPWRRAMVRLQLSGLQKAAVVFHSTRDIRAGILGHHLIDGSRLVAAPYGIADEFWRPPAGALPADVRGPYLLHVGSNARRKRIDVLLRTFAAAHSVRPELKLVQLGAPLTAELQLLAASLGIERFLIQPEQLSRPQLASLYARAELVLVPSEREGFGLPVLEALAAGAVVVASDLPSLREVGGDAVTYCRVGDVDDWSSTVTRLLRQPGDRPSPQARRSQAERFTWGAHAQRIASAYRQFGPEA